MSTAIHSGAPCGAFAAWGRPARALMHRGRAGIGTAVLAGLALGVAVGPVAWGAGAADGAVLDTLLRGVEHRGALVEGAKGVLGIEVVASEEYLAARRWELDEQFAAGGFADPPELQRRDIACVRFAYDRDRYAWHFALLNDSGWDWWGIGERLGTATRGKPPLASLHGGGASDGEYTYSYNGNQRTCTVRPRTGTSRAHELLGIFDAHFVRTFGPAYLHVFRTDMAPRLLGETRVDGEVCSVVGGVGTHPAPKGMKRLWISPRLGFAVVRMEKIEINDKGRVSTCLVQTASSFQQFGEDLWLPGVFRIDHFGFLGQDVGWDFTKRFFLEHVVVNQPVAFRISDYMFPANSTWFDASDRAMLWDGGQAIRRRIEGLPLPTPDPLGEQVRQHADDLEQWFMQVPAG